MEHQEIGQFTPLRDASQRALSTSGQSRPSTCPSEVAATRAGILLACYRKGDAEEPEIYVASVAAILSSYPLEVAYRVTDPRTGLGGKSQWLPTVAEVRVACEAEMAPSRAQARRAAERAHTRNVVEGNYKPSRREVPRAIREIQSALDSRGKPSDHLDARNAPTPEIASQIRERLNSHIETLRDRYASEPILFSEELQRSNAAHALAQSQLGDADGR
jgi:hypothetical protein